MFVVRNVKLLWRRTLAALLFALVPTGDIVYANALLRKICESEGGLRVSRVVEGVDGFLMKGPGPAWVKQYGYKFVETHRGGKTFALRLTSSGEVQEVEIPKAQSTFELIRLEEQSPPFVKLTYVVQSIEDKQILGRFIDFNYYGGWLQKLISVDGPNLQAHCTEGNVDVGPTRVVPSVLKPSH